MLIHSLLASIVFLSGSLIVFCRDPKPDAFQNTLGHIKPQTSPEVQAEAARGVAERLLGRERAAKFLMVVNPDLDPTGLDTFLIKKNSLDQVEIFGSTGVAAAWGLHYYLKTYCNVHISWEGNQIELPQTLPDVRVKVTSNDRYEVASKEDETTRKPQGKNMISHILYEAAIAEFIATSMKPISPNYVAIWFPDKIYSEHFKYIDKMHLSNPFAPV